MIITNTAKQIITFKNKSYPISTSKYGLGEEEGSFKTPRGKFKIWQKIGSDAEIYTIFIARKPTTIWDKNDTKNDLILSRILWLDGVEEHNKNTKNRFIYIHGTNDEKNIGRPASIGCIRMLNQDIIELFKLVKNQEIVEII